MEKKWHILYCDASMKLCPITDFIESCGPKKQVKIFRFLELLEKMGPTLPRPYADILHHGIHELRLKLKGEQIRFLYFFCYEQFIVLYNVLVKHTERVSEKYIQEIIEYRNRFLERVKESKLRRFIDENIQKVS